MTELILPPVHPDTLEYGATVINYAATTLRQKIAELTTSGDPSLLVDIKTDPRGAQSPVTQYDLATEQLIGGFYENTSVRIKGEEATTSWSADKRASLEIHVDPIDGTELFIEYVQSLIDWSQQSEETRGQPPICGSMVSAGGLRPSSHIPEWAAIAAPFLSVDGVVSWTVGPYTAAARIEPGNTSYQLPLANDLTAPEIGGVVLVASNSTEQNCGAALRNAGYRVIKYKSAVAAALCAMDPGLFERLRPGELGDEQIVGVVMRNAKDWDVAGTMAIADQLGHFVGHIDGSPRTLGEGANGAIFAISQAIGKRLVKTVAR